MDRMDDVLSAIDYMVNTKRKRHMLGGILLSVSLLFGGLAFTVITLKDEENNDEQYLE